MNGFYLHVMLNICLSVKKRARDMMLMLGLNEIVDQLAMASSAHWYGYALKMKGAHVLRRALDFEVEH